MAECLHSHGRAFILRRPRSVRSVHTSKFEANPAYFLRTSFPVATDADADHLTMVNSKMSGCLLLTKSKIKISNVELAIVEYCLTLRLTFH